MKRALLSPQRLGTRIKFFLNSLEDGQAVAWGRSPEVIGVLGYPAAHTRKASSSLHPWLGAGLVPPMGIRLSLGTGTLSQLPMVLKPQNQLRTLNPSPQTFGPLKSHISNTFLLESIGFPNRTYRGQTDETRINEECPRRDRQEQRGPLSWRSCTLLEPLPLQRNTVSFPLPCIPSWVPPVSIFLS